MVVVVASALVGVVDGGLAVVVLRCTVVVVRRFVVVVMSGSVVGAVNSGSSLTAVVGAVVGRGTVMLEVGGSRFDSGRLGERAEKAKRRARRPTNPTIAPKMMRRSM